MVNGYPQLTTSTRLSVKCMPITKVGAHHRKNHFYLVTVTVEPLLFIYIKICNEYIICTVVHIKPKELDPYACFVLPFRTVTGIDNKTVLQA